MSEQYEWVDGSDSGHCCFEATVRDMETQEHLCECFEVNDAQLIIIAVNNHNQLVEALRDVIEVASEADLEASGGLDRVVEARAILEELGFHDNHG